jgi:hypothetical protein
VAQEQITLQEEELRQTGEPLALVQEVVVKLQVRLVKEVMDQEVLLEVEAEAEATTEVEAEATIKVVAVDLPTLEE